MPSIEGSGIKRFAIAQMALAFLTIPSAVAAEQATATVTVPMPTRLADVKVIYVAPLGSGNEAEMIRQKMINKLCRSTVLTVTESAEDADAILVGSSDVDRSHYLSANFNGGYGFASGGTNYRATSVVRLLNRKRQILWTAEAASRHFLGGRRSVGEATSSVAGRTVDKLTKAIQDARLQVANSQPSQPTQ